jgi:hypothetical protein
VHCAVRSDNSFLVMKVGMLSVFLLEGRATLEVSTVTMTTVWTQFVFIITATVIKQLFLNLHQDVLIKCKPQENTHRKHLGRGNLSEQSALST